MALADISGFPVEFAFFATFACVYALLSLGLNLQWGMTGLFNAGVAAFYAIGAYVTAILITGPAPPVAGVYPGHLGGFSQNWLVALAASALVAGFVGFLIAIPTLRLRTDYLAIATLGLGEVIRLYLINAAPVTGGTIGIFFIPKLFANVTVTRDVWGQMLLTAILGGTVSALVGLAGLALLRGRYKAYGAMPKGGRRLLLAMLVGGVLFAALGAIEMFVAPKLTASVAVPQGWQQIFIAVVAGLIVLATFLVLEYLERSPWARALKAIREDEDAAEVLGKDTFAFKLLTFVLGSAIMGVAGSVFTVFLVYIEPAQTFAPLVTFTVWAMLILGGGGNNKGAILGAFLFYFMDWESSRIQIDLSGTTGIPTVTPVLTQVASTVAVILPFLILDVVAVVLVLVWSRLARGERLWLLLALLGSLVASVAGTIALVTGLDLAPGESFPFSLRNLLLVAGILGVAAAAAGIAGIYQARGRARGAAPFRPAWKNLRKRVVGLGLWVAGEALLARALWWTFQHPDYLANNISYFRLMLVGLLLVVFVVYRPQGLIPERLLTVRRRSA